MRDLWINENDLIVATHGRSFWILDDISPLREITASLTDLLFKPAPAYRVQRDANTDTPLPPDEPAAQNPPDGAAIDYYLARASSAPITLEILDAEGKLVRRFSSTDKPEVTEEQLKKQLIPLYWIGMTKVLSIGGGMHRWVWDLHYPAPVSTRHEYPIAAIPHDTPRMPLGPTALPGLYTVRLTVNGKSDSAPLTIKMDPRVKTPAAGLENKFQLEMRLASLMTQTSEAVVQAGSIREQLDKMNEQHAASDSIQAFQKKLGAILGATSGFLALPSAELTLARLNGQVGALYGQVWQVDAEPTASQLQAAAAVERDSSDVMRRWDSFKSADLPAFNRELRAASLPEVRLESDVRKDEAVSDEE
jgi:hypothetical protein